MICFLFVFILQKVCHVASDIQTCSILFVCLTFSKFHNVAHCHRIDFPHCCFPHLLCSCVGEKKPEKISDKKTIFYLATGKYGVVLNIVENDHAAV